MIHVDELHHLTDFATKLLDVTEGCRHNMREPDEQGLECRVAGNTLDNAHGESLTVTSVIDGYQELLVILERDHNPPQVFNLATLIALARVGAEQIVRSQ